MFTINQEVWDINFVPYDHYMLQKRDGTYALGVCVDDHKTIYISNELPPHLEKKVLCHEIVHAAMFSYNIYLDYAQEELMADIIATYGEEIICITNMIFSKLREGTY